jgi:hypothetical protein
LVATRTVSALTDGQIDRRAVRGASGMVTTLPPLRDGQGPVAALQAQVLDVRAGRL